MKNSISVPRMASLPQDAVAVPALLDSLNVEFTRISVANWSDEYPYTPQTAFRVAWCPEGLVLHYKVEEQSVRATFADDDNKVWTDSCVEFFVRNADTDSYYNIECNCVGTLLIGVGPVEKRSRLPLSVLAEVKRWASLGRVPFGVRESSTVWELALVVPATVFANQPITLEKGAILRANFYKCGDDTSVPHFVSWSPIHTEMPCFHCPEYFGELMLR